MLKITERDFKSAAVDLSSNGINIATFRENLSAVPKVSSQRTDQKNIDFLSNNKIMKW